MASASGAEPFRFTERPLPERGIAPDALSVRPCGLLAEAEARVTVLLAKLPARDASIVVMPAAWSAGMKSLLSVTVPNDRLGCLQDIHWPSGGWGYFPTYTLGAMTAAQIFDAACKAEAAILPGIGKGDFNPLVGWLRANDSP